MIPPGERGPIDGGREAFSEPSDEGCQVTRSGRQEARAEGPHNDVYARDRPSQMATAVDHPISKAESWNLGANPSTPLAGSVLDMQARVVVDPVASLDQAHGEIDLFGRVEEALVVASNLIECLPPHGVAGTYEVGDLARSVRLGSTPYGQLMARGLTVGSGDAKGDSTQCGVREQLLDPGQIGESDGIVVEEHEDVTHGGPAEQVPPTCHSQVLFGPQPGGGGNGFEGRLRRVVEDNHLVEPKSANRVQGVLQLGGPLVDQNAETDRGHAVILEHGPAVAAEC